MNFDPREILEMLRLEIEVIERGGYLPSVRDPRKELRIFRDSVSCPNLALENKVEPCVHCWLAQFIPAQHLDKEVPCHYIALNERGDTVASLLERGDAEGARTTLLGWLKRKVAELERQGAAA
jgi:hypothetical protein